MRRVFLVLSILSLAGFGFAAEDKASDDSAAAGISPARVVSPDGRHVQLYPTNLREEGPAKAIQARGSNLVNHGGPVIHHANVVAIFWGPEWSSNSTLAGVRSHIVSFFTGFGTTGEYNVITQYNDSTGFISTTALGPINVQDSSTPPTNVTDAAIQGAVARYVGNTSPDPSAIYEVFLGPSHYASFGTSDSCGGPNLVFCAYHGNFTLNGVDTKYASMPYPSCSGCQWSGFTDAQNFDHFACHETREAVTDPDGTAWYDRRGNEADDKCAWSPAPFLDAGFGYQYEWSNAAGGCVKTR